MVIKKRESEKFTNPNLLLSVFKWWIENIWVARGVALVALVNLGIVFFDLTYIPLRDFWLLGKVTVGKFNFGPYNYNGLTLKILPSKISKFITNYDIVKGIVPYRDTNDYLKEVNQLEESIKNYGLNSPQSQAILASLRESSVEMITEDPFKLANKTGTLEKIKNLMRDYVPNPRHSSKEAFDEFWSVNYLQNKTEQKLQFFNQEIRPLIETNYYRPYSETGGFVDYFALVDFPFFVIIAIDFLGRSLYISLRYSGVNWLDGMLWRWYDLIFFLPGFRWLRVIPVTIRLDQTELISLKAIKKQASQGFVASIAGDITEVIILRIISQVQNSIQEGNVKNIIPFSANSQEYIDLNDTNEIVEITKLIINLTAEQVLPKIRPEVEILLAYIIEKAIIESPAYQNTKDLLSLGNFPKKISQTISTQLYQVILDVISNLLKEDPLFELYLHKIIEKFTKTMTSEITAQQTMEQIEELLVDFLEEFKINYVQKLSQEDIENILEQIRMSR